MTKFFSLLLGALLCSGCVANLPKNLGATSAAPDVSPVKISSRYETQPMALAKLPPDTALVMATVVQMIRGEKTNVGGVSVSPGINLAEPGLPLESFGFTGLTILDRLEREVTKGQSWETKTTAVLHFGLGPWSALMLTETVSVVSQSGIVISNASVRSMSPAQPRVAAWFVPKAKFMAALDKDKGKPMPVWDLMDLASQLAVPIRSGQSATKEDYLAVAFVLDRLEPGDSIKGWVSNSSNPAPLFALTTAAQNAVGFPVLLLPVEGPLNDKAAEHFVHVVWRPTDADRTGGANVDVPVGRFSTYQASSDKHVAQPSIGANTPGRTTAAAAPVSASPGAATSTVGTPVAAAPPRLLKLTVQADAKLVQGKLKSLGFYEGSVDGAFGKGSQAALVKFKTAKGLERTPNWDARTQAAMFGENGP